MILWIFESFVRLTYGDQVWEKVLSDLDLHLHSVEPMFHYDDQIGLSILRQLSIEQKRDRHSLLEDFGTFLVTDARVERVRRLLRFGGVDFTEFLHSLEDLKGRARLAVPDLILPEMQVDETHPHRFEITCENIPVGAPYVLLGALRALADDYGSLVFLEVSEEKSSGVVILASLLESQHAEGREFLWATEGAP
ncbi:heme NO-binding domain-containing protein [Aliiroseovarius halocynthiae]|uniref:heme NO-binding domain-containing protein n=1 Tax=Aliiroseovarius halocynthiae TaxID=985055 RepID=UPI0024B8493F|nr:heme NO-binding domain-containing protein [Aliiroseovarius halocynthiae]